MKEINTIVTDIIDPHRFFRPAEMITTVVKEIKSLEKKFDNTRKETYYTIQYVYR